MKVQDPLWEELNQIQSKLKKDIGEKLMELEREALYVRMEMENCGVFYPATTL